MRVAVYYNNHDVRLEERPIPKIGPGEMLVKVIASGICGSDVLEWYRIKKAPLVLGHEMSGEIVEVGADVDKYTVGQRVFVTHHVPCNTCKYCLDGNHTACELLHSTNFDPGGFSEYLRIPAINIDCGTWVLPDEVSYEQGVFIEPLGCVVRGQRSSNLKPGQTVLVLGAGQAGLLHIALAKAYGAGRIIATDISDFRKEAARRFGADVVLDGREDIPQLVREVNAGWLADQVIVCTGAYPAFMQALKSVERGGTVLTFATTDPGVDLPIPANEFWRNSIAVLPSYGAAPIDLDIALRLIQFRRVPVDDMISHRLPLADIQEGFRLAAEAHDSIKVVIKPQE